MSPDGPESLPCPSLGSLRPARRIAARATTGTVPDSRRRPRAERRPAPSPRRREAHAVLFGSPRQRSGMTFPHRAGTLKLTPSRPETDCGKRGAGLIHGLYVRGFRAASLLDRLRAVGPVTAAPACMETGSAASAPPRGDRANRIGTNTRRPGARTPSPWTPACRGSDRPFRAGTAILRAPGLKVPRARGADVHPRPDSHPVAYPRRPAPSRSRRLLHGLNRGGRARRTRPSNGIDQGPSRKRSAGLSRTRPAVETASWTCWEPLPQVSNVEIGVTQWMRRV
jgi:hypothetical protein